MTFYSAQFLIFLPVVLVLYYLAPHKYRWAVLLAASYYAYMSWNPQLVVLILGTTAVSYAAGLLMPRARSKSMKRLILAGTAVICLGTLVFFKYMNFLLDSAVHFLNLFSPRFTAPSLNLVLPVGISFYTFQTLSYVIDVYRGATEPEPHFGYYALFVSYFPQLVAGPIERPGALIPQLRSEHRFSWDNIAIGFQIMAAGFFRKTVAADFFGAIVNRVYSDIEHATALSIAAAALLFMGQIYNDFAGYSEIAMGAARMMGITLTRNFDRPLSARSVKELMRRWHITLNTWFRDYVYIPLGGSRKGKARWILNVMLVYALCGLWHGANWTYVTWGLLVGVVIIAEGTLSPLIERFFRQHHIIGESTGVQLLGHIWVLLVCGFAAVIFRSISMEHAVHIFARFFSSFGFGAAYFAQTVQSLAINSMDLLELALICAALISVRDMSDHPLEKQTDAAAQSRQLAHAAVKCYLVLAVLTAWLTASDTGNMSSFVYFQF